MKNIPPVGSSDPAMRQLAENVSKSLTDTRLVIERHEVQLQPLLKNALLTGLLLTEIVLAAGVNSLEHGLSRKPQGWLITRQRASATVWDTQDSNTTPEKTLSLNASAPVTIDLYVF